MLTKELIADIEKRAFQQACGEPIAWTRELEVVASGYCKYLADAAHEPDLNPLQVCQMVASALALAVYARNIGWNSHKAFDQASTYAAEVRRRSLSKWKGQVVVVSGKGTTAHHAPASTTKH